MGTVICLRTAVSYTILHISDLHRAEADPIGNDELLSALLADRDRFVGEDPPIPDPDAIIVSGDLVQGALLETTDHTDIMAGQYAVAADFLSRLADEFLGGDRARLVVVPGNHDVDWNMSFSAMSPVDPSELPPSFSPALCGPTANLRWRWDKLQAYRIVDRELYEERLAMFEHLVNSFYSHTAEVVQGQYFRVHTLYGGRIGVVAFDSCVGNDCFAFHGAIHEEAVAQAHMALRTLGHELLIAVWHHNIEGDPDATDYMAPSTVHRLIGKGFRVGLHGHQHRGAAALRYIHLPEEERMAVISAGSLCAGPGDLPPGVNRQYNLIELSDDLCSALVHVREMAIATNFAPARRTEFGDRSYVQLKWRLPPTSAQGTLDRQQRLMLDAEAAFAAGNAETAVAILRRLTRPLPHYARTLLLESLRGSRRWQEVVDEFSSPATIAELVAVVWAMGNLGNSRGADALLKAHASRLGLTGPVEQDLRDALAALGSVT